MDEIYQCPTCGSVGKAPKNEIQNIDTLPLNKIIQDNLKLLPCGGAMLVNTDEVSIAIKDYLKVKFGSSGKRPLNWEEVEKVFCGESMSSETFQLYDSNQAVPLFKTDIQQGIKEICKEFAHAEVSEERLADIIFKERTCYTYQEMKEIYDRKSRDLSICECSMDSQCNDYIWDECVNTAKAIKAELERK